MRIYKCISLVGLISLWLTGISLASTPNNVRITNVTQSQFTISWITDVEEIGYIRWGTNTNSLSEIALDDRDKEMGTATIKGDTHHVTATSTPTISIGSQTTYYYEIVSGIQTSAVGSITTGADISGSSGVPLYGYIYKCGPLPATGTIVYLNLESASGTSALRSVLILSEGFWVESPGNFRIPDLSAFFTYSGTDTLCIYAEGAKDGTATLTRMISESSPAPNIIIPPDTTPPGTPTVTDDGTYTTNNTQLHAVWQAEDLESGIIEYIYAIGITKDGTDTVDWTSVGTQTEVTKSGLSLIHSNTYYFSVKAKNRARLWSDGYSDGIKLDTTPPGTPTITDDGTYTTNNIQLHAVWQAEDLESGIIEYLYAIGTTKGGTDTVEWTSVGTQSEVTKDGLSLIHGNIYYFSIKAKNQVGIWSNIGYSNGIEVDIEALPNKLITPTGNVYVKQNFEVCYVLGEDSISATLTFTYTGGNLDAIIHLYPLNPLTELTTGTHTIVLDTLGLVDGTIYSMSLNSTDLRGNSASKITNTDIAYLNVVSYAELPIRMHQTNITNSQFTISWVTNTPVSGYIEYGTTTVLGIRSYDNQVGYTHYVNVTGLSSLSTYYYDIVSGGVLENLPGIHYTIITGAEFTSPSEPLVYGYIYKWGPLPATGTIVYLHLESTSGTSALRSVLILSKGFWVESPGNFRTLDLSHSFAYSDTNTLCIYAEGAKDGTASLTLKISESSPAPDIVIPPDTTPPGTPSVTDDGSYTNIKTQLHAICQAQDLQSGIIEYMYAIGMTKGGTDTVDWISVGTKTEITKTNLNLLYDTTYYFSIKAKNREGNWSKIGYSDGIIVANYSTHLPAKIPVYPNPFVHSKGYTTITFGGINEGRLTKEVTIKIFTIAGELVNTIENSNCNGQLQWTPPHNLASGIYLYLITNPAGEQVKGKLGIIK